MLLNNWYVAERVNKVGHKPIGVRMLGVDVVLFRDAGGVIRCLSAACCHRGGALDKGEIKNGCVACPYHGWEFNGDGQCTKIPAMGDDVVPPKRARIDSYPVQEKYGMVWVFMGDEEEAERPQIPDWFEPFLNSPDWRLVTYDYLWTDTNWVRLGENSIDTSHPSFVHKAFGNRLSPKANIVPIHDTPYGAMLTRERPAPPIENKTGGMAKILPKDRKTTRVTLQWSLVGITEMLYQEMTSEITQVLFSARTPVDDLNVRSFGFQARNFLMDASYDQERIDGLNAALLEDHNIVRHVRPKFTPKSTTEEFLIEADGMELTFRRKVQEWARARGHVDGARLEADSKSQILVVPSPGRRTDPKGWVHRTVPRLSVPEADVKAAE
jgi:phenylpropionate dioxygenase-like ring-hydroxylating dioxygenase large terminal subunit